MAPTRSWPVTRAPDAAGEVADCLGGAVHLAYAELPDAGLAVITAGFAGYEAQTVARARARLRALHHLRTLPGGDQAGDVAAELRLADFLADPPESVRASVAGVGLLSGKRYRLPAEVVWTGDQECLVEPATAGVVDHGVPEAIADVLAQDVVIRWWAGPSRPLLRVSAYLDRLLPDGVMASAGRLGLRVSAFVLSAPGARIALVVVGGDGATLAVAAGRTVKAAVGEAFLRAMAAKAQPWSTLPLADCLRRFAVWHREGDYAAYLEGRAADAGPRLVDELGGLRPSSWPEIAARRFGHEPVAVEAGPGEAVKVVCPGAALYRAAGAATPLPCPIP